MLKIRNPHGEGEYSGPYSDKDPVWRTVDVAERKRIGMQDEDDGVFFLEFENFRKYYEDV